MKIRSSIILMLLVFTIQSNAQSLNKEIANQGETRFLLGKINKNDLQGEHYKAWFNKNYSDYEPNINFINSISSALKTYSITLFMGTWCGDSKKEVPRLYKVLDACNFPMDQLTVVAVSRAANMYKQSPKHEEKGLNIHRVPTVIFYKDGKEVNRIVEHPIETFEEDIQIIITTNDYKSNYQIVNAVDHILKKKGLKGLKRKRKKLLKTYRGNVSSMYELNTYGRILYATDRTKEAIAVYSLNTELFPNQPSAYMSLANTLGISGEKEQAIKVLENAIQLHPENNDLKENLEVIKSN